MLRTEPRRVDRVDTLLNILESIDILKAKYYLRVKEAIVRGLGAPKRGRG